VAQSSHYVIIIIDILKKIASKGIVKNYTFAPGTLAYLLHYEWVAQSVVIKSGPTASAKIVKVVDTIV
jgi:hypothetical protein